MDVDMPTSIKDRLSDTSEGVKLHNRSTHPRVCKSMKDASCAQNAGKTPVHLRFARSPPRPPPPPPPLAVPPPPNRTSLPDLHVQVGFWTLMRAMLTLMTLMSTTMTLMTLMRATMTQVSALSERLFMHQALRYWCMRPTHVRGLQLLVYEALQSGSPSETFRLLVYEA